jgi:hypothetical protein
LSGNEGSPGSSSTNADDWITNLIILFISFLPPSSRFIYILPDDPVWHSFVFGFVFSRKMSSTQEEKRELFLPRVYLLLIGFSNITPTLSRLAFDIELLWNNVDCTLKIKDLCKCLPVFLWTAGNN